MRLYSSSIFKGRYLRFAWSVAMYSQIERAEIEVAAGDVDKDFAMLV